VGKASNHQKAASPRREAGPQPAARVATTTNRLA